MTARIILLAVFASMLAACGGQAQAQQTGTASAPATSAPTATPTPVPKANALTTWCALKLGEPKATVIDAMSATDAVVTHDDDVIIAALLQSAASFGEPNLTAVMWYASHSTLLATFDAGGNTVELQAYVKGTLTTASTEVTCTAFRS
jgi:hypothetical protein